MSTSDINSSSKSRFCTECGAQAPQGAFCPQCGSPLEQSTMASPRLLTTADAKASILAELWIEHRSDEDWADYMEYNDLGLPLAYAVANGVAEVGDQGRRFISEAFDLMLKALGIEDTGFQKLDDVFDAANEA